MLTITLSIEHLEHSLKGAINVKLITSVFIFFLLFFFVYSLGSWFLLVERAIIMALLFLVIILCSAQLIVIGKY